MVCLTGKPPFSAANLRDIQSEFEKKPIVFEGTFAPETIALLKSLLQTDMNRRPSIEAVLSHPALQRNAAHNERPLTPQEKTLLIENFQQNTGGARADGPCELPDELTRVRAQAEKNVPVLDPTANFFDDIYVAPPVSDNSDFFAKAHVQTQVPQTPSPSPSPFSANNIQGSQITSPPYHRQAIPNSYIKPGHSNFAPSYSNAPPIQISSNPQSSRYISSAQPPPNYRSPLAKHMIPPLSVNSSRSHLYPPNQSWVGLNSMVNPPSTHSSFVPNQHQQVQSAYMFTNRR